MLKFGMTTLRDIAEQCQVSISAVSLAIHKPHKISREQKEKILLKAHELGYFRKKQLKINRILLVCDNFNNTYFGDYYNRVFFGVFDNLRQEDITIQIRGDFNVEYSDIYESNGIIFVGNVPGEWLAKAQKFRVPFVLCGHPDPESKYPALIFDIERGIGDLIDYVVSCGHKKIGMLVGESAQNDAIFRAKISGFKKAMQANNIPIHEKQIVFSPYNNLRAVETALNKLLSQKITALFCGDDYFAYFVYQIFKKWKVNIPMDISIVGFDGVPVPDYLETPKPFMTTVLTDQILLGRESVAILKEMIANPGKEYGRKVLPVSLRVGDSVKRLAKNTAV